MYKISDASIDDLPAVRGLFLEYAASLPFDLSFQNFDRELENLPGEYSAPGGCLLLAIYDGDVAGCVGLRDLGDGYCEMKRLFVKSAYRGKHIGKSLAEAVIKRSRALGYDRMRLDTASSMKEAISIYKSLGFKETGAYRFNPLKDAIYMELMLR